MVDEESIAPISTEYAYVADREKAQEQLAPKIKRGMEAIAKVARLYIKHGKPPSWIHRVQTLDGAKWQPEDRTQLQVTLNRKERRALVRQFNQGLQPERLVAGCKRCGLLYVGPADKRCQCPVVTLGKVAL